jgi:hypothetical protein
MRFAAYSNAIEVNVQANAVASAASVLIFMMAPSIPDYGRFIKGVISK